MKGILASLAALSLLVTAAMASEEPPARPVAFQIAAQSLDSALVEFSQQSGLQLVVTSDTIRGKSTRGVKGSFQPTAALTVLLEGLGLEYSVVNPRSLAIRAAKASKAEPTGATSAVKERPLEESLRLARVEKEVGEKTIAPGTDEEERNKDSRGIPEVLVKGRRSLNVDIERTEDDPQPYVVFSREEIQRSQAVNLDEFLRTRLPMNTTAGSAGQVTGSSDTRSSINLRGLGENQTLILVDGRRMPGAPAGSNIDSGIPLQPDLNGIPLEAIERIEILPSTAGGIYGGSATGGVINVVLRRDFQGMDAKVTYANTFDTDAANVRLDVSGGFSLEGGRTRVMVSASRSHANTLVQSDRDFTGRAIGLQLANNPVAITGSVTPPLGATINIRSVSGELVLKPQYGGAALGSGITHLPLGYAGAASDSGAALIGNAGQYNLDLPAGVNGVGRGLVAVPTLESFSVNIRREFAERLEGFLDLSRLGNTGRTHSTNVVPNSVILSAAAPNNPFDQDIRVRFPVPDLSFDHHSEFTTVRALAGGIARLPNNWMVAAEYVWSRARFQSEFSSFAMDTVANCVLARGVAAGIDPDGAGPLTPCAVGDSRPALNVMQEGNSFPIDFTPYLLPSPNVFIGPRDILSKEVTVRLSGPLMHLAAGPLNFSALMTRREEALQDSVTTGVNTTTRAPTYSFLPHRSQDVDALYLEVRAPLISARNTRRLVRELEFQASARRDEYSTRSVPAVSGYGIPSRDGPFPVLDYGTGQARSTEYTLAMRYSPVESVNLRASIGTGFLPPSVGQIVSTEFVRNGNLGSLTDPRRGNTPIFTGQQWSFIQGGSPDLQPEHSESWSAGLVLTPHFAPGLRISADLTRIDKVDEIRALPVQFWLDYESIFPQRITRGPNLPTDPSGWAGPIEVINSTQANIARTSVEAWDVNVDYLLQTEKSGQFHWYVLSTLQRHYQIQPETFVPAVENVGFSGGPLQWRGNLGMNWTKGSLSLGWNAQYYDAYRIHAATASPASIAAAVLNQGSAMIPRQIYHDLVGTYRFDRSAAFSGGVLANTELTFGIQNLFDTMPPILAATITDAITHYSPYGDPRLRRYSISIRKSFN